MTDPKQGPPEMWTSPPAARLRDLPEPDRSQFLKWLRGRTIPDLHGVADGEQDVFYLHDYRYWKSCWKSPEPPAP